jgi:hypothetical protein
MLLRNPARDVAALVVLEKRGVPDVTEKASQ